MSRKHQQAHKTVPTRRTPPPLLGISRLHADADSNLCRNFPRFWCGISRRLRRSDFASRVRSMQLPRIGDRVSRATKGEFPARVFRGETNNLDSLWRIAEHSLNLSLNYSGFESSGPQGARARRAKSARRNVRRFCDPSGYASHVFLHFRHKRKRYPPRSSGVGTASEGMSRTHNVNSMMESSMVTALHLCFVRSWPTCRSSKSRLGCDRSGSESD